MASDTALTHYDPDHDLRLAADTSACGVGWVLFPVMPGGTEKPVAFSLLTLNETEKL